MVPACSFMKHQNEKTQEIFIISRGKFILFHGCLTALPFTSTFAKRGLAPLKQGIFLNDFKIQKILSAFLSSFERIN